MLSNSFDYDDAGNVLVDGLPQPPIHWDEEDQQAWFADVIKNAPHEVDGTALLLPASRHTHIRDRLLSLNDLANIPPVRPLVSGLLYRETLAQLAGPPGCYKTFLTLGLACAVALGESWEGHTINEGGPVVYVCPEGASGMRARVLAWCQLNAVNPDRLTGRLYFLPEPVQLGEVVDVTEAVEVAAELSALLLILDTRARCTIGLDENSATDQGRAIDAAERIQRKSGCTVLAVHHTGRHGEHGRGSNAWDGAVWSDLRVDGTDLHAKIHCEKHKDIPDGCDHHYRMVLHTVPETLMPGSTEQQRTTLVAVRFTEPDSPVSDRRSDRTVLDIIRTAGGEEGLTRGQIASLAAEVSLSRSQSYVAINSLVRGGFIKNISTTSAFKFAAQSTHTFAHEEA